MDYTLSGRLRDNKMLLLLYLWLEIGAKRLKTRVEELERVIEEQRLVNQQQTLIILELVKEICSLLDFSYK